MFSPSFYRFSSFFTIFSSFQDDVIFFSHKFIFLRQKLDKIHENSNIYGQLSQNFSGRFAAGYGQLSQNPSDVANGSEISKYRAKSPINLGERGGGILMGFYE